MTIKPIKGSSSHQINILADEKCFYWQAGYGVVSLSARGIPYIKSYINNQKERHRDNDLLEILEFISET